MEIALLLLEFCLFIAFGGGEVKRPQGVAISKASLYDPSAHKDFTCLDGNGFISFDQVNDDYCDCADGSDEPGTSACPNGHFHCTNAGYKPKYIPSSRVNDGVCDCCDGTDEYNGKLTCANYCRELGKQFREELDKQRIMELEGHELFKEYSHKGREARKEKQERLQVVMDEKTEWEVTKSEREEFKNLAEIPEKEAKDKHKKAWEEQKELQKIEKNAEDCKKAFDDIDANDDNVITLYEMQLHKEFDIDSNGQVSLEEAKEYLEERDEVVYEQFFSTIWDQIKDIYKHSSEQPKEEVEEEKKEWIEGEEQLDAESDEPGRSRGDQGDQQPFGELNEDLRQYADAEQVEDRDDEDRDDDEDDDEDEEPEEEEDYYDDDLELDHEDDDFKDIKEDESMPEYDAEAKRLIESADSARELFREAEQKVKELERELKDLETLLALDLGKHFQFYPLRGECYEYTDLEYTYKLCPFDKCSQRNKHGGIETSLGVWGHWAGEEGVIYSAMKYEKGQNCWHGPDRSCKVVIECGIHNEVLKASEPNRCEYEFKFTSPAACSSPPTEEEKDPFHDEL